MTTQDTFQTTPRDPFHWLLRIALASSFLYHGVTKFPDLAGGAANFDLSVPIFTLVAVGEVLVGLGILVAGMLQTKLGDVGTRLCGAGAIVILLGAIVMVHWGQWSFAPSETHPIGGMEFQTILILISAVFVLRGNQA